MREQQKLLALDLGFCKDVLTMKTERKQFTTLKAWRESTGLNRSEAAKVLNVSIASYSRYERFAAPNRVKAKRIAEKTGVPVTSILRIA